MPVKTGQRDGLRRGVAVRAFSVGVGGPGCSPRTQINFPVVPEAALRATLGILARTQNHAEPK